MSAQFRLASRVTIVENEQSFLPDGQLSTPIAAIVGPFRKGPMEETLCRTGDEFIKKFEGTTAWTFASHSAIAFLKKGRGIMVKRVTDKARAAGLIACNDVFSNINSNRLTQVVSAPGGSLETWDVADRHIIYVSFGTGGFVASNSIELILNDGTNTYTTTVAYQTSHAVTLQAIRDALTTLSNTGIASTVSPGGAVIASDVTNSSKLILQAPQGKTWTDCQINITGGASQATVAIKNSSTAMPKLFEMWAANPGAWGNQLGVKIVNQYTSTYQQWDLAFSADLVSGNVVTFQMTYRGQVYNFSRTYASSSNTTLNALANDIQAELGVPGAVSWNQSARKIQVLNPDPIIGRNSLSFSQPIVTNGASQATVTVTQAQVPSRKDETFDIEVYSRTNQVRALEKWRVSLQKVTDGFGNSLYIEDVINERSDYIRVNHYAGNPLGQLAGVGSSTFYWMAGGTNGSVPTDAMIATGWAAFQDIKKFPRLRYLINGGHTASVVQQAMITCAETRKDCVAFLDVSSASNAASSAVTFRDTLAADTNRAALFVNDLKIIDPFSARPIWVPPSGYAAALYAAAQEIAPWENGAGLIAGALGGMGVMDVRYRYTDAELDSMSEAQINPMIYSEQLGGFCLSDSWTLQKIMSAMSFLPARLNLLHIEVALADVLPFYLQKKITSNTLYQIRQFVDRLLLPMKRQEGIYNYDFQCDIGKTMSAEDVEGGTIKAKLFVDLVRYGRRIEVEVIPTRYGTDFNEIG